MSLTLKCHKKNYMIRIYQNVLRTTVFKTRTLVFFAGIFFLNTVFSTVYRQLY